MSPELSKLLQDRDERFWTNVRDQAFRASEFQELLAASRLLKKAWASSFYPPAKGRTKLKLAMIGAYSFHPLCELVEVLFQVSGFDLEVWKGDFDNYESEIRDAQSGLYRFKPEVVLIVPSRLRSGPLPSVGATRKAQSERIAEISGEIHELCRLVYEGTRAEVLLANFIPQPFLDPGSLRAKTLGSDWNFYRALNLELGLGAESYTTICDFELHACRRGLLQVLDQRAWFESRQIGSPDFLLDVAREVFFVFRSLRTAPKKVLVVDLDNTLWGGVIGDDGWEGIELGDTSPRGEAFKEFQRTIHSLKERGVLLAVCSKNLPETATAAFVNHPEMVLKIEDFAAFKVSFEPKSEAIAKMSQELGLGLSDFVFIDDSPAEIEIVRQFLPEVTTLLADADPSRRVQQLKDSRLFEPRAITREDAARTELYRQESARQALQARSTDMDSYLRSLKMVGTITPFVRGDVPRIAQLINKSNQFNLTTKRRSEAEVLQVLSDPEIRGFSFRLSDRFSDHGLIAVVILRKEGQDVLAVDTWLMSCRVLTRQVEEETVNEMLRVARELGVQRIQGQYIPTPKNGMVADLYLRMGFKKEGERNGVSEFSLVVSEAKELPTGIEVVRGRET